MTPRRRLCKNFGTPVGCAYGANCHFYHPGPEPGLSVMDNLSEALTVIHVSHAPPRSELPDAKIVGRKDVASFNWTTEQNQIVVPGMPPKLAPPDFPLQLNLDRDVYGQDLLENQKAPHPHAFEPLMLAVMTMSPGIQFSDVNVISGLNTLRKLFSIIEDNPSFPYVTAEARVDVEIIGNTVLLRRWHRVQSSATNMTLTGCGRGFEEACTSIVPGFEDCTSYHRVSAVRIGGLSCLVQGEADAVMDTAESLDTARCEQGGDGSSIADKPELQHSTLRIRRKGMPLDIEDITEIKSRSIQSDLGQDIWIHLWLSGVSKLFLGKHHYGGFSEHNVGLLDVSKTLHEWEERNVEKITKFCRMLEEIYRRILTVVSCGENKDRLLALVLNSSGTEVTLHRRAENNHVLPEKLEVLFERRRVE